MYMYMCIYLYTYTQILTYTYIYIYMYLYIYICIWYTNIYIYIFTYVQMYMFVQLLAGADARMWHFLGGQSNDESGMQICKCQLKLQQLPLGFLHVNHAVGPLQQLI